MDATLSPLLFALLALLPLLVVLSGTAVRAKALAACALLLLLSAWWFIDRLSGDGVNAATLYHLQADMEGAGVREFARPISVFVACALLSLAVLLLPRWRRLRLRRHGGAVLAGFIATWCAALALSPLPGDVQRAVSALRPADAGVVAGEYARIDRAIRKPRNIVWIYAESLERTYFDPHQFPGLLPNLQRLARQGIDVRHLDSVEGTGWTIGGMVGALCGIPLTTTPGDENSMGRMERFLPGARCLPDALREQGYTNRFVGGADSAFAGKGRFLRSHGFDEVHDRSYFERSGVAREHFSEWGVHDDVMLEDAWRSFQALASQAQPFMLVALTMDTHHPAGHLPLSCRGQRHASRHGDIGLLHALKCSDRLIGQLVDRIRASPHAGDTLVVVSSDHLAMPNDLERVLRGMPRENLMLVLGNDIAPRQVDARHASTLDAGATVLQLLDPRMAALGFGRSVLDDSLRGSASAAARGGRSGQYARYLAYARSLWMPGRDGRVRLDADGRVAIGGQRVEPPVLLQYGQDGVLQAITMEDAVRRLQALPATDSAVYVQRCLAFEDRTPHDRADGEWCALTVDPQRGARLVGEARLRKGLAPGEDAGAPAALGPQARQAVTLANRIERAARGSYWLQLQADQHPDRPFWLEAVSAEGQVLASERVRADAHGVIHLPLQLGSAVDVVRLRAWLDTRETLRVSSESLLPVRAMAGARPAGTPSSSRAARSRG